MRLAVVGAGRVGTAIAVVLGRAGHEVVGVSGRDRTRRLAEVHLPGVPVGPPADIVRGADLVWIAVPDDLIGPTASALVADAALDPGVWVAHLSGSRGPDALADVREAGARPLAIHPLQTFPDVEGAIERLPGCTIAIAADDEEGLDLAEALALDLGGRPFRLADDRRPLYHAAAVFASNYLVATTAVAEELFAMAGVPEPSAAMRPLQETTLDNVRRLGANAALTGPAARGDLHTIERNLEALVVAAPRAVAAYVALARVAADLALADGRLTSERRRGVDEVLARWS